MNTSQFIGFMQSPENLGKDAGAQLNNLTREFPYFQTAQLLYVKSLHNESSFLYNNQLKIAAAYAVNRRVLYELITRKAEDEGSDSLAKTQGRKDDEEDSLAKTQRRKDDEGDSPAKTQRRNDDEEDSLAKTQGRKEESIAETHSQEDITQSQKEEAKPETSTHQNLKDKLKDDSGEWDESVIRQLQLLRHWQHDPQSGAPFIQYKKEEKKIEQEPVTPENKSEEMPVPPVTAAEEMQDILTVLIEPGEEDVVISIEESIEDAVSEEETGNEELDYEITTLGSEEIVEQEKHIVKPEDPVTQEIFSKAIGSSIELEVSDVLPTPEELQPKAKQEAWTSGESEETVTDTAEEPLSDSPLSFAQWLKEVNRRALYQGMSGAEKREDEHEEQDELIDKFIQEAPRIKPQRSEFYNPVNMAKKSVTEDSELITETLARIYEKQGNIPKAIRAYQKLSLKFPEKSLYFASLIENLKKTPNKNSK